MSSHQQERPFSIAIQERLHRLCVRFHFADVNCVRNALAQSGAIISGSAALAVLQPQIKEPNDIDFYVPPRGLAQLLKFILAHGYELTPEEGDYSPRIVLKLVHPVSATRIDIVVPAKSVVEEVTRFHSTVVMNYVAYYGVVSLYPSWTLSKMGAIVRDGGKEGYCIQKYRDRGYTMVNEPSVLEHPAKRSTFDNETLFIPFENVVPHLPLFEVKEIEWTLGKTRTGTGRDE
jgi:hypothetical protein